MVASLAERLQHLMDMGLDYLTLNRETTTLSGASRSGSRWFGIWAAA